MYLTKLISATDSEDKPYTDWRKIKYVGKVGLLEFVKTPNGGNCFRWRLTEGNAVIEKGIRSSRIVDVKGETGELTIYTLNSKYVFQVIRMYV